MNLILIPGAWSDGSIWSPLEAELSKLGIESQAITLSGLQKGGESKAIELKTHVDNVVTYLNSLKTNQSILVGHSYSGLVASLVADQIPKK